MDENKVSYSLKKYKKNLILGPIFKSFEVIFEIFIPFLIKYIIDDGIKEAQQGNFKQIIIPSCLILLMCIFCFLSTLVCQYLSSVCSQGFGTSLRDRIFKKVSTLKLNTLDEYGKGNLVNLLTNDTNRLQVGVATLIRLVIRAPILVIGCLIMTLFISINAFLIILVSIVIISIIIGIIFYFSSKKVLSLQTKLDKLSLISNDNLNGMKVIKAFNKNDFEINKFKENNETYFKEAKKNQLINSLINPFIYLILNIASILIVYLGSKEGSFLSQSSLSSGSLTALIQYLNQITTALIVVFNIVVVLTKAQSSRVRVNSFFALKESIDNGKLNSFNENNNEVIKFNDVSFKYSDNDDSYVLENINFSINKNEKIGIIGGTGSGKTSLIRLIERFFNVSKGTIYLYGKNINNYSLDFLKDNITYVNQKSSLISKTLKENIVLSQKKEYLEKDLIESLNMASCDFILNDLNKLNEYLEEGGKNLSGGQKQRLSLARGFFKDSKILLLDDVTSSLDYLTESKIRENISKIKDKVVVLISQKINTIKDCDKIIVLNNGRVDSIGKHEELLSKSKIYKEFYDSQVDINV